MHVPLHDLAFLIVLFNTNHFDETSLSARLHRLRPYLLTLPSNIDTLLTTYPWADYCTHIIVSSVNAAEI